MDKTQFLAIFSGVFVFVFVLELVRRRELREEYSWLWLAMSGGFLLVAVFPKTFLWFTTLIGTRQPAVTFNFLGVFFLALICIQFSVRLSRLTNRNKHLAQQIAILDSELRILYAQIGRNKDHHMRESVNMSADYEQTEPATPY